MQRTTMQKHGCAQAPPSAVLNLPGRVATPFQQRRRGRSHQVMRCRHHGAPDGDIHCDECPCDPRARCQSVQVILESTLRGNWVRRWRVPWRSARNHRRVHSVHDGLLRSRIKHVQWKAWCLALAQKVTTWATRSSGSCRVEFKVHHHRIADSLNCHPSHFGPSKRVMFALQQRG